MFRLLTDKMHIAPSSHLYLAFSLYQVICPVSAVLTTSSIKKLTNVTEDCTAKIKTSLQLRPDEAVQVQLHNHIDGPDGTDDTEDVRSEDF